MTHSLWWDLLIGMASALLIAWIALVVVLVIARPAADCCARPCGSCRTYFA
jgi:hypothetical protein